MKKLYLLMSLIGLVMVLAACGSTKPAATQKVEVTEESVIVEEATATDEIIATEGVVTSESADTPIPAAIELVAAPTPDGRTLQPLLANANIDLDEVQTLLPPDAIPAILPESVVQYMVTAEEAETMGIPPTTRVLGVSINGDSRAYPIPFMSSHEIVNDEVGGQLIAATW